MRNSRLRVLFRHRALHRPNRCDGSDGRRDPGCWMACAVGPAVPGQQERKQAEKCIARHAHLPAQAASWASHSPQPRRRRGGPREARAVGRARPDMGNLNQNGRRMQESRFGERHRRGRHKHRHRRESLGSTHGCTLHVRSILKLRLEQESGSALRTRATGIAPSFACVLTLSALLIV